MTVTQPVRGRRVARELLTFLIAGASLCFVGTTAAIAQQSALLNNGQSVRGRLVQTDDTFAFVTEGRLTQTHPLVDLKYITCDSPATDLQLAGPMRQFHFSGGDRMTGEALPSGPDRWNFRLRTRAEHSVLRAAIAAIVQPPSQVLRQYEDFTVTSEKPTHPEDPLAHSAPHCLQLQPGQEREWPLTEPLATGSVQVWFLGNAQANDWGVEVRGPSTESAMVRVLLGGREGVYSIDGGSFSMQRLRRTAGWHCLSLSIAKGRLRMSVDGALLADGHPGFPSIGRVELFHRGPLAPSSDVRFDDLLIVEQSSDRTPTGMLPALRQDLVVLRSGDELFGRVLEVSPLHVRLQGPLDTLSLRWQGLRSVAWGDAPRAIALPVQGQFARMELTSVVGLGDEPVDVLTGAITGVTTNDLQFEHPWLGKLSVPLRQVRRITPDGEGRRQLLDSRTHHLGDEVRAEFARQVPEGTVLSVQVTLDKVPAGDTFVLVSATDLEPAGPRTAPSPLLDELQRGHLTTELRVNDEKVADLNRFANWKESAQPVRLRIAVPARFWRPGPNVLKFVQRPQAGEPGSLDDCELSEIILETSPY